MKQNDSDNIGTIIFGLFIFNWILSLFCGLAKLAINALF